MTLSVSQYLELPRYCGLRQGHECFICGITGISALLSLLSLGWGIAAYGKAMRLYRADKQHLSWTGHILQTMWRFGTMSSRVTAMVLFASVCGPWTLLVLGK